MKNTKGFTLVELSIAILIIGLLTASIIAGNSMIRQAGLQSIIKDVNKIKTSIHSFKSQYKALPGDIPNGTIYWPPPCGTDAAAVDSNCNGNGNGIIDTDIQALETTTEATVFWYHLLRAELIDGQYNAIGSYCSTNNYKSNNINAKYIIVGGASYFDIPVDTYNGLYVSNRNIASCLRGFLTTREAKSIDEKADDGVANTGIVYASGGSSSNPRCSDHRTGPGADYDLSTSDPDCHMVFWLDKQ